MVSATETDETLEEKVARLEALIGSLTTTTVPANLPPNAFQSPDDGLWYHEVERVSDSGNKLTQRRRLALTMEEALEKRLDFYHPRLGLIWDGHKLASDRTDREKINDSSNTIPPTLVNGR